MIDLAAAADRPAPAHDGRTRRLPVTIVTGFLGSGKTTLINRLLTGSHGLRLGIVVHEYGEVGIDDALVARSDSDITELVNGCQYCGDQGRLPRALARLSQAADKLDGIVIEASGLADPLGIVDAVAAGGYACDLEVGAVISLVDCANYDRNLSNATIAYQQLVSADLLILTKTDLVDQQTADLITSRLGGVNQRAGILRPHPEGFPVELLLNTEASRIGRAPLPVDTLSTAHLHDIDVVSLSTDRPLDPQRFANWSEGLAPEVIRAKGVVRFASHPGPYAFQKVGAGPQALTVLPEGAADPSGAVVVLFGKALNKAVLEAGLQGCVPF
ncbi:CobW family GTP-binding protein [Streptomyces sp. NPDC051217]|uniref:CobW family GTP-binding protein n=1 Tax=Streptomyces sp. NPDC051217 TaxID=3365644 RepID=UPI0037B602A0